MASVKPSQYAKHGRIVVGRGLCLFVVVPFVGEVVVDIRAADYGTIEDVGILSLSAIPCVVAFSAAHKRGIGLNGDNRGGTMVDLPGVRLPIANHIAGASWIVS